MDPSATLFPDAEVREEDDHVSTATGDEGDDCCAICLGTLSDAVALPSCRRALVVCACLVSSHPGE